MYSKNNFNKIKEVFDKKGYVNINSFFSDDDIGDLIECSSKIKQHSMSGLWKYIKIYREYPKIKFLIGNLFFWTKIILFLISLTPNKKLFLSMAFVSLYFDLE